MARDPIAKGFDFILVEGGKIHAAVFRGGPNVVALVDNDTYDLVRIA